MKKILSVIMAAALLTAIIPVGTFTTSAATYSGTCGDNVTWEYDTETATLTISGTGAMHNYDISSYNSSTVTTAPWRQYYNSIKTVVVENGVISIGWYAFYYCYKITSIFIPDSVTTIGYCAFFSCNELKSITISDNIMSIGGEAFDNTLWYNNQPNGLVYIGKVAYKYKGACPDNIIIKDGTQSISDNAFYNCTELISISIPDSVISIGSYAFLETAWYNNQPDGLVYAGKVLYEYKGTCPAIIVVKSGTLGIASYAFGEQNKLASITMPNSIKSIGDCAFYQCFQLSSITIPDSVTSIGVCVFDGCTKLESINVDGENPIYHSSENCLIETNCKILVSGCKSSRIPADGSVMSIGYGAFSHCEGPESITIPNSVTSIDDYAFFNNNGIKSIAIPDSVVSIGESAFYVCSMLNTVIYCGTSQQWNNISIGSGNNSLISANRKYHLYNNDWYTSLKATCIETGTKYRLCTICGNEDRKSISPLGHNYVNKVNEKYFKSTADCTCGVVYYKSCSRCGNKSSETFESGEPLGHDYVNTVDDKYLKYVADCTHAAVYYQSCSRCGNKTSKTFENGEPLGHDYVISVVTPPTCTKQGYTTHTCTSCGDSYKNNYTYMPCGENCGFIIDGNTLYIHGNGETNNYKTQASVPWHEYADSIAEIVIDEEITKAGNYAFYCLENLKSIKTNNSNLDFGKYAINTTSTYITVFAENDGSLETYCTKNGLNYIDPTITPELETVTANGITIKAVDGYEYSKDGETWQKSNKFTGLSPASEYIIYARYAATADMFDTLGTPLIVTTLKLTISAPTAPDYQSHTDNSITLAPNDLYEYSMDGENWQKSSGFTGLSKDTIYRFYQRVAETETEYASESSAALIIAIPDKPEILEAGYENIIVKLVDGFEYCLDDFVWQDSNSFDMLIDNTEYYVYQRLKSIGGERVYQITSDCAAVATDNSIAHTHTLGEWLYNEQNHWQICINCGEKFDESAHTPSDWITDIEPTIESAGHKHIECTVCGYILEEKNIAQLPEYTPGDINDDGKVNNKDLTRLFQKLSGWDVDVNEATLDINGDSKVNNKDLTRLFQYLSGWAVEIF